MADSNYVDLTLARAAQSTISDDQARDLIRMLSRRVLAVRQEMDFFRAWCDRADKLYFPTTFTKGGADLWPEDSSATTKGRSHISVNSGGHHVDIPASLQAVIPVENFLASDTTDKARAAADAQKRVYQAWKREVGHDLKFSKAAIVKALYGRTAGRVYLVKEDGEWYPEFEVIEQPRNLWFGWKTDSYNEFEWVAYLTRFDPNALAETYGVAVSSYDNADRTKMPWIGPLPPEMQYDTQSQQVRPWMDFGKAKIEVWDFWYRKVVMKNGRPVLTTCNVVIAGNALIVGPNEHPEYGDDLPYEPLFNTFIPGVPMGRPELWDAEPLIREKMEMLTAGSQMIHNAVAGDFWQLVGPDAPTRVPAGLKPKRNEVIGPGAGNRIEAITPFIAQFQFEQYLGRIDREQAEITGLNDLLLGLVPLQSLSSSKAVNALIANYETRISIRRALFYEWRRAIWTKAKKIWKKKNPILKKILADGDAYLEIKDPSLSPRDEMETATRAGNLMTGKLWSQRHAMMEVGIDDPETEQDLIREESTDATLFPDRVEVMAQVLSILQSLGINAPGPLQEQASQQLGRGQEDMRKALGAGTPQNTDSSQLPGDQGITPPIEGAPPQAGGQQPPFAAAQQPAILQGMIQGGKSKTRILTQQKLGRR